MAPARTAATRHADDTERLSPSPQPFGLAAIWQDDDDDDHMEYQPSSEQSEDHTQSELDEEEEEDDDDDDDDDESEYMDAADSLSGAEIEFFVAEEHQNRDADGGGENNGEQTETETTQDTAPRYPPSPSTPARLLHPANIPTGTIEQINQVLRGHGPLRRLLLSHYRFVNRPSRRLDADDAQNSGYGGFGSRRRKPKVAAEYAKVPNEQGNALMESGTYGCTPHFIDKRRKRKSTLSEQLMWRRLGLDPRGSCCRANRLLAQDMVPDASVADKVIHYDSRAYSGQFSDDGNFFFSCTQNFKVRMYDTSNPYEWKYYKTVDYPFGQWTITDATLSPDNRYLAYSSIRHKVCLAPTDFSDHSDHTLLDFTSATRGTRSGRDNYPYGYMGHQGFGIWSLRFSGDGREIVAGTSAHSVVVYDLERRQSILELQNHDDHVNAVCFGDTSSPHILYSGSDDQTLRVWDRRSMADGREVGVFVGHTEGLTYVDSKGDGRYVLSNGKDQTMKLWDLRTMVSPHAFDQMDLRPYTNNFDYRFNTYDESDYRPNPHDCSIVTFRGHSVLKTLIRCHFSPPGSTNSRYVYSGSEDGKVWIWNMDATVRATIDVGAATKGSRPHRSGGRLHGYDMLDRHGSSWETCVRDASWSPVAPVIAATSWNGWDMATGTVTQHSWSGGADEDEADPPVGSNYDWRLDLCKDYNNAAEAGRRGRGPHGRLRSNPVRSQRYGVDNEEEPQSDALDEWGENW